MEKRNIRQLKNNPSEALRRARTGPVLIMKGDEPEALLVHLDLESMDDAADISLALACALFKDAAVSLGRAARIARVPVTELISHLSRLGIAIVRGDQTGDRETLDEWLASS